MGFFVGGGGTVDGGGSLFFRETVLSSAAAEIIVDSIPQTGMSLDIELLGRVTTAGGGQVISIQFNTEASASHDEIRFEVDDNAAVTAAGASAVSTPTIGVLQGANAGAVSADYFGLIRVRVPDYRGSKFKTYTAEGWRFAVAAPLDIRVGHAAGVVRFTDAITRVRVAVSGDTFVSGSALRVFGF